MASIRHLLTYLALALAAQGLLVGAAQAGPAGYTRSFGIDITEQSGVELTDHQVRLVLDTATPIAAGQLQADADDLVFTSEGTCGDGAVLPHWIESGVNTATTVVWVKVPTLPASATTRIIAWHDNAAATATSSATSVFDGDPNLAGQPFSSTDQVASGGAGGVGNSQRGFRFAPTRDILVLQFGKREPTGTTRYVTLFNVATQAILHQQQIAGPAGQYSYADLPSPIWLTEGTQYTLQLYQNTADGYYFGTSNQASDFIQYFDMRYCNGCTKDTFPTSALANYHYGYPDLTYVTRKTAMTEPTSAVAATSCAPSATCDPDCSTATCGDGFANAAAGEECDDGNNADTDACTTACQDAACGDGFVQTGVEACDDGNDVETDACLTTCVAASCGDGYVRAGVEMCDDGNDVDTDACRNTCGPASCGDGVVHAGVEMCDDGNSVDTDACRNSCATASCGDGVTRTGVEACDDGNVVETDACRNNCTMAACGDGVVYASVEACDDGNTVDTDACRADCTAARCGDGVVQAGVEACDDGNTSDADDCLATCAAATCGDGVVQDGVEECDDGSAADNTACLADCTLPEDGGGCCSTAGSPLRQLPGITALALLVAATTLRRRRRPARARS